MYNLFTDGNSFVKVSIDCMERTNAGDAEIVVITYLETRDFNGLTSNETEVVSEVFEGE